MSGGNPDGGQWTSGAGGSASASVAAAPAAATAPPLVTGRSVAIDAPPSALLGDGVYRPGVDSAPKFIPVQESEPIEGEPGDSERTPEETALLAQYGQRVRDALKQVEALDPNWRPPDQLTATDASGHPSVADQLKNAQEIIGAAQARMDELRRQRADFPGEPPLERSNMQDKLQGYALNPQNPKNRGKAAWFRSALGFDQSNWQDLADQIYFDESTAEPRKLTPDGQTYRQRIVIRGANGRSVDVDFGFIKSSSGVVRLTTAMPTPR